MEKELEIVKAYLTEYYINEKDNIAIEQYFTDLYADDTIYYATDKENKTYYVNVDTHRLYSENEFFYEVILNDKNYLSHLYDEWCINEEFEEFEKNIEFDKNGQYMIPLITKFGVLYYYSNKEFDFEYTLLDSDKNFLTNIYTTETEDIIKCNTIIEFVDLIGNYISYADNLNDLLDIINYTITENNVNYGCNDELMTIEDLKDNDYLNRIGKTYIFFMECI